MLHFIINIGVFKYVGIFKINGVLLLKTTHVSWSLCFVQLGVYFEVRDYTSYLNVQS
jgi:hypothetical protein